MQFKCKTSEQMRLHIERVLQGEYGSGIPADYLTILDIGANIGSFTFWASQIFPRAYIHAYEPNGKNCEEFRENMERSALPHYRYALHEAAVCTHDQPVITLFEGSKNNGMHSVNQGLAGQSIETFEAQVINPRMLPKADMLKIDTEGCEVDIISNYLAAGNSPSQISFEFHSAQDRWTLEDLLRKDYILSKGEILFPTLGTLNFVHRSLFRILDGKEV